MVLHALVSTPLCILTLILGCKLSHCASVSVEQASNAYDDDVSNYISSSMDSFKRQPEEGEAGYRYSYTGEAYIQNMYEGVVICLLAVTAFIGLVVWVLKSNFEERQTRRMRREASLRDRNSNVSPLMTPDSEDS